MKTIATFLLLLVISLSSCSSDDDVEILNSNLQTRTFEVKTPQGWRLIEDQGIDTYFGRITNDRETIFFDQGYLSYGPLEHVEESENSMYFEQMEIFGVPAIIEKRTFPEDPDTDIILTFYTDNGDMQNRMYVKDPDNEDLVLQIFKSHRFIENQHQ